MESESIVTIGHRFAALQLVAATVSTCAGGPASPVMMPVDTCPGTSIGIHRLSGAAPNQPLKVGALM